MKLISDLTRERIEAHFRARPAVNVAQEQLELLEFEEFETKFKDLFTKKGGPQTQVPVIKQQQEAKFTRPQGTNVRQNVLARRPGGRRIAFEQTPEYQQAELARQNALRVNDIVARIARKRQAISRDVYFSERQAREHMQYGTTQTQVVPDVPRGPQAYGRVQRQRVNLMTPNEMRD